MEEANFFKERAMQTEHSILTKMYDEKTGLFYSLDARYNRDRQIKMSTISSLMPLILETISKPQVERLVDEHLYNPNEFWLNYPLPAEPYGSNSDKVENHVIWRGLQTWIYPNWYIAKGLRRQASRFPEHSQRYNDIADQLTLKSYELVRKEGFQDFYQAETGEGSKVCNFGWSTLVLDMVYNDMRGRCTH